MINDYINLCMYLGTVIYLLLVNRGICEGKPWLLPALTLSYVCFGAAWVIESFTH